MSRVNGWLTVELQLSLLTYLCPEVSVFLSLSINKPSASPGFSQLLTASHRFSQLLCSIDWGC